MHEYVWTEYRIIRKESFEKEFIRDKTKSSLKEGDSIKRIVTLTAFDLQYDGVLCDLYTQNCPFSFIKDTLDRRRRDHTSEA